MGEADTTMEARLAAVTASISETRVLLASCARSLGVKEQKWQETTRDSVATMTTSLFAPDQVREQLKTKPSSPSFVCTYQVVAAGAPHANGVVTPTMPTRCSTLGSAVNIGNNPALVAFPTSGMTQLPALTLSGTGDRALHSAGSTGTNTPAGYSTHILTSPQEGFVHGARVVNTEQSCSNSFPRFDGTNPGLWRERCLEFFTKFNICKPFWTTAARMHMDGKAKEWFEGYRLRHVVSDWSEFMDAVEANFGACDFYQELQVQLLPSETLFVGVSHSMREEMLVVSEDKPKVEGIVRQTYDVPHDDSELHDTSGQKLKWCGASLQDVNDMVEPLPEDNTEVLTHVGGMSLFSELGLDCTEELFADRPSKDTVWDDGLANIVLTHIGGLPLFPEQVMDTHQELEREMDNPPCLYHGLSRAGSVFRVVPLTHQKLQQLPSREMLHGSDISTLFLPWDPGAWIIFVPWMSRLSWEHQPVRVVTCVFSAGKEVREVVHCMLDELTPWSRNGFSPGLYVQPHLGRMPSWMHRGFSPGVHIFSFITETRVFCSQVWIKGFLEEFSMIVSIALFSVTSRMEVNHDSLPIICARVDTCSVEQLALCKCISYVATAAVFILLNLAPEDACCLIQKLFSCLVCLLYMTQKFYLGNNIQTYEGSVCMGAFESRGENQLSFCMNAKYAVQLHGHLMLSLVDDATAATRSEQHFWLVNVKNQNVHSYAVTFELEVMYWPSDPAIWSVISEGVTKLIAGSRLKSSLHDSALELAFVKVIWQYQSGQWASFFQEEMVHRNQKEAPSRLFGFNINQLCNMSKHDGIPWDPGGIHGNRIRAIAWGQAIFCQGGSVTPGIFSVLHLSAGLVYMDSAQQINLGDERINDTRDQHEKASNRRLKSETLVLSCLSSSSSGLDPLLPQVRCYHKHYCIDLTSR